MSRVVQEWFSPPGLTRLSFHCWLLVYFLFLFFNIGSKRAARSTARSVFFWFYIYAYNFICYCLKRLARKGLRSVLRTVREGNPMHTADVQLHRALPRTMVKHSPWVALQQTSALASKLQL